MFKFTKVELRHLTAMHAFMHTPQIAGVKKMYADMKCADKSENVEWNLLGYRRQNQKCVKILFETNFVNLIE